MELYAGVDIGTSGCKAVLFDGTGHQMAMAYREYDVISQSEGWAELDTKEVIEKCFDVIRETASMVSPATIVGISISSQGEAFTLIDKEGKALCNALVSSDTRANDLMGQFVAEFGAERLHNITGHTAHPMFSLFKLLWIKEECPELWALTHRILCFEDLLQYRLGIENPAMGWSLAGRTMLFDIRKHQWSIEILDKIGVHKGMLSNPLPSGILAGYISDEIAVRLNLPGRPFIVTGGHDQPCAALGAGAVKSGVAAYNIGTVECITPCATDPLISKSLFKKNLCTYDHVLPGLYASVAFSLTGGNILKWFKDQIGSGDPTDLNSLDSDSYENIIGEIPDKPSRLMVLPYFTASGTPYFDVSVKGAILGLDLTVTRFELLKGLLEGVAFEMKLNLEILNQAGYEIGELRVIGGGSKSRKIMQLKADVIGMPITVMDVSESGCKGTAMLVYATSAGKEITEIVHNWSKPVSIIKPDNKEFYQKKFSTYRSLYPMVKSLQ